MRWIRGTAAFVLATIVGCGGGDFLELHRVDDAPEIIRDRREAIVRVVLETPTGRGAGTGFFITGPYFVTNAHVLGTEECGRPGCYVSIRSDYERGRAYDDRYLFMVPHAIDQPNDVAVYVPHVTKGGPKYDPPAFVDYRNASEPNPGDTIHIVGHPYATLKKWSSGEVYDRTGDGVWAEAVVAPGNSGSPVFDDDGRFVGLATLLSFHVSDQEPQLDTFAVAAEHLTALLARTSTESDFVDVESLTEAEVPEHATKLFAADVRTLGENREILDVLGDACDRALEAPAPTTTDEAYDLYRACGMPMRWLDCEPEDRFPAARCRPEIARADWESRLARLSSAVHGVSDALYRRAHYQRRRVDRNLESPEFWVAIQPVAPEVEAPYSVEDAVRHLAWSATDASAPHAWAVDTMKDYRDVPGYERQGEVVLDGLFLLGTHGVYDESELKSKVGDLYRDARLNLLGHLVTEAAIDELDWGSLF